MAAARAVRPRALRGARLRAAWPAAACAAAAAIACVAAGRAGAFAGTPLSGAAAAPRAGGWAGRGLRPIVRRAEGAVGVLTRGVYETRTLTLEPGRLGIEVAEKTGRVLELGDGAAKDAGVGQGWTFVEVEGYEFDINTLASYSQGDRSYEVVLATPRPNPTAIFDTNYGTIKAEIWLDRTPITASNFIDLATMGFYNDQHVHRIVPGFIAQFGCPYSRELPAMAAGDIEANKLGTGGPGQSERSFVNLVTGQSVPRSGGNIPDEFSSEDSNEPGTLSMANAGPNSGGSQFFFNVGQNSMLDWFSEGLSKHPVFGKVTEGYDVVEKITQAKAYPTEIPVDLIRVSKVTIEGL